MILTLDRAVANIFVCFGSVRIKKQAVCPKSKGNKKIQREARKQDMHPTRVHVFVHFYYKNWKEIRKLKMTKKAGCGAV